MKKYLLFLILVLSATLINAQVNVTFKVDMNMASGFDKATDTVSVRGDFNDWGTTPMTEDSNNVYSVTVPLDAGTHFYKFYHNGGGVDNWESDQDYENTGSPGNRSVTVESTEITAGTYFFDQIGAYTGITTTVEFNVDMRLPIKSGELTPGVTNVFVAGNFTDWQNGAIAMTDDDGDSVYTVSDDTLMSGTVLYYKFIYSADSASGGSWESDPNRTYGIVDTGNIISANWDRKDPDVTLADGNLIFNVDMSVLSEVGIFDPDADSLHLRSSFNGWNSSDPLQSHMNQDFLNPDNWYLDVSFTKKAVNSVENFKYFVIQPDTMWADTYERPFSQGGGNRDVTYLGQADQNIDLVYYDDVTPDYVILDDGIQITFSVDMTDAADAEKQVPTFDPATDKVWWISEQPAFVYTQGWVDSDTMKVLEMTDPDGDMVYTGTLTVKAPSWNGFEYVYGFQSGADFNRETTGFGDYSYRVRYISQEGSRKFTQPYSAPVDTWIPAENKSTEWEAAPAGNPTGVESTGLIANKFELSQNYPNPFNPSTQINFSIPKNDLVTLKIYNTLGQEVATLINRQMKPGSYEVNFNASNLASGVYFYNLTAGSYTSTMKMILLK